MKFRHKRRSCPNALITERGQVTHPCLLPSDPDAPPLAVQEGFRVTFGDAADDPDLIEIDPADVEMGAT